MPRSLFITVAALVAALFASWAAPSNAAGNSKVAIFAGGCFWCMEPPFEKLDGVVDVVSGYSGGSEVAPTYEQVSSGRTGHAEAVQVHGGTVWAGAAPGGGARMRMWLPVAAGPPPELPPPGTGPSGPAAPPSGPP